MLQILLMLISFSTGSYLFLNSLLFSFSFGKWDRPFLVTEYSRWEIRFGLGKCGLYTGIHVFSSVKSKISRPNTKGLCFPAFIRTFSWIYILSLYFQDPIVLVLFVNFYDTIDYYFYHLLKMFFESVMAFQVSNVSYWFRGNFWHVFFFSLVVHYQVKFTN